MRATAGTVAQVRLCMCGRESEVKEIKCFYKGVYFLSVIPVIPNHKGTH